jgi:hypothetical protein
VVFPFLGMLYILSPNHESFANESWHCGYPNRMENLILQCRSSVGFEHILIFCENHLKIIVLRFQCSKDEMMNVKNLAYCAFQKKHFQNP